MKIEEKLLAVLQENAEACKHLVEEDAKRSAQDILNETYEDLIAIFEKIISEHKPRKVFKIIKDDVVLGTMEREVSEEEYNSWTGTKEICYE
jgi:hypothetical protein